MLVLTLDDVCRGHLNTGGPANEITLNLINKYICLVRYMKTKNCQMPGQGNCGIKLASIKAAQIKKLQPTQALPLTD